MAPRQLRYWSSALSLTIAGLMLIGGLAVLGQVARASPAQVESTEPVTVAARPESVLSTVPAEASGLKLIENVGQFDPRGRFLLRHGLGATWLAQDGLWLSLADMPALAGADSTKLEPDETAEIAAANVKLSFLGANPRPVLEPFGADPATVSYLIGNDPGGWHVDVPVWQGVRYRDLYSGIDLVISSDALPKTGYLLPWTLVAGPGADLSQVRLRVDGVDDLQVDSGGLQLGTALGEVAIMLPVVEGIAGTSGDQIAVGLPALTELPTGSFVVDRPFASSVDMETMAPLAVNDLEDLIYSTYLGGVDSDQGAAIAIDATGAAFVTGFTPSADFPTAAGSYSTTLALLDAFIAKLNADGTGLIYSTFVGGANQDFGRDLVLIGGQAYIIGRTGSQDFPTTVGAYDSTCGNDGLCDGWQDGIIFGLSADGTSPVYSTYLGGSDIDDIMSVAASGGQLFMVGRTESVDFPTSSGAYDRSCGTDGKCNTSGGIPVADAFLVKLDPGGNGVNDLVYSTFLGGRSFDMANAVAVAGGQALITGQSDSFDFLNPATYGGGRDAFLVRINPLGGGASDLVLGRYIGGIGIDVGNTVAVVGSTAYVAGTSSSANLPVTTGAYQGGQSDAFLFRLDGTGAITYGAYLGGGDDDSIEDLVLESGGGLVLAGFTDSSDFPTTTDGFDTTYGGSRDAFVTRIDFNSSDPQFITYASFLGGLNLDSGEAVVVDSDGHAYLTGRTESAGFPTTIGAFSEIISGSFDVFVTKISVTDPPAIAIEKSTNGQDADDAPGPYLYAGDPLTWVYTVTNSGGSELTNVEVNDDPLGFICSSSSLAPGSSFDCTVQGTAQLGQHENIATVTADPPPGLDPVTAQDPSHYFGANPVIALEKRVMDLDADSAPGPLLLAGAPITWTIEVTNSGNVRLDSIAITDTVFGDVACPANVLFPGQSMDCTITGTALLGQQSNTAEASANPPLPLARISSDPDSAYYLGVTPALTIEKATNGQDADSTPGPYLVKDAAVSWTYQVSNTGTVALSNVQVFDDNGTPGNPGDDYLVCTITTLTVGSPPVSCTVNGTVLAGQYGNVGRVTGQVTLGTGDVVTVEDSDPSHYFGVEAILSLEKRTNGLLVTEPPGPLVPVGEPITWSYTVTNESNTSLSSISLSDDPAGAVSCPKISLAIGESMFCEKSGTAAAGQYTNTASAEGTSPAGNTAGDTAASYYFGTDPAISVEKATNGQDADSPPGPNVLIGTQPTFSYQVHNSGNITLTFVLTDDVEGPVTTCPTYTLGPDETTTCNLTATNPAVLGLYSNLATVVGTPPVGGVVTDTDPSHYTGVDVGVALRKTVDGQDADSAPGPYIPVGQPVAFQYTITNTGGVVLTNISLTDSDPSLVVDCQGQTTLDPGLAMTCTASATAATGQYTNTARVEADSTLGPPSPTEDMGHYFGSDPAISLRKLTNSRDVSAPPGPIILVGKAVTWTYQVTNTGNVTLQNVAISDDGGFSPACQATTLAPDEATTCTFVDPFADAGQYSNTATATADPPVGSVSPAQDSSYYFGAEPLLTLQKRTNGVDADLAPGVYLLAGAAVEWTYTVTNSGNITLSNVAVSDDQLGPITCPKSSLAVDEAMTCTANGTTIDGQYANVGSVSGRVLLDNGQFAQAADDDPSHYYGVNAAVVLEKRTNGQLASSPPGPLVPAGQQVTWTYLVANEGNATLSNIVLTDDPLGTITCPKNSLAANENMQCTRNGTSVAGQYTNTADVEAVSPAGNTVTDTAVSHYYGSDPAIDLEKATNGQDADSGTGPYVLVGPGKTVTFTYAITNTGNVDLTGISLSDDKLGPVTCPSSVLVPDESMVCQRIEPVVAGQQANLGTVTANPEVGSPVQDSDPSHYFGAEPGISISKRTNGEDADLPPGPYILVGQSVTWEYEVSNTGNVTLTNVTVTDDQGVLVNCAQTTLAVGQSMTCSASDQATLGQYANTGLASGASPVPDASAEDSDPSHYFGSQPALSLEKRTNGNSADNPPGPPIIVGDPVNWTYLAHNTGNVPLTNLVVTDDQGVVVSCPDTSLDVDETVTCNGAGTAVGGQYANLGTATASPPPGLAQVQSQNASHYQGISPSIDIEAFSNGQQADSPPGLYLQVGQMVTWTYEVTNDGDATLVNVAVVDDQQGAISCPKNLLVAGESMTCQASGSAQPGQYAAVAEVTANPLDNSQVFSDQDPTHYFGALLGLGLAKRTEGLDAETAPGPFVLVGDTVNWTYVVTNTSNVQLTSVSVSDDQVSPVSCPKSILAAGEAMTCTASKAAVAGQHSNLATAGGLPPAGLPGQTAQDQSHYFGAAPAISLAKRVNGQNAANPPGPYLVPGETISWTFEVTNSGNVTLSNVAVSDDRLGPVSCPDRPLAAGASLTCMASSVAATGQQTNTATATATSPLGALAPISDSAHYFGVAAGLSLAKQTNGQDAAVPPGPSIFEGEPVTWTYQVENTGNIFLENVSLVDDRQGALTCPKSRLEAGEAMTCTLVGAAEVGQYSNEATVSGDPPAGPAPVASDISHYLGLSTTPSVDIQKYTNGRDADIAPGPLVAVGAPVNWSYVVVNTGAVPIVNIAVSDDKLGSITCPRTELDGAPDSMTCTVSGTAATGQYSNLATISGNASVGGQEVSDSDPSHYFGSAPALDIQARVQGVDADSAPGFHVEAGDTLNWTYTVTNIGNVALSGLAVSDTHGPAVTCAKRGLAPAEATTCTANGIAATGQHSGTATATASSAIGQVVNDADATYYFGATLGLSLTKRTNGQTAAAAPGPYLEAGKTVTWTYQVTNDSNVSLNGLLVLDNPAGAATCPQTSLAPGQSVTCFIEAIAAAGQYSNTAAATAEPPEPLPDQEANDVGFYFGSAPGLVLEKHTNGQDADSAPGPYITVGDTVSWTYSLTNTGNVTLIDVQVQDNQDEVVDCPTDFLAPGEGMVCTAAGSAGLGQYQNEGVAAGSPPVGGPVEDSDLSHYFGGRPAVSLQKRTNGQNADTAPGAAILVGQPVNWSYQVTNSGNTSLSFISVADDDSNVSVSCPLSALPPGASMNCTAAGVADLGPYQNRGTVTAQAPAGLGAVNDDDLSHYFGYVDEPAVSLTKRTNGQDADEAPGPYILAGDPVTWAYEVANSGNITLTNVVVSDSRGLQPDCPGDTLAPQSVMVCTAAGTAALGQYDNLGSVSAEPEGGGPAVSDSDLSHYFGASPAISLEKRTNGVVAAVPPGPYIGVGQLVQWAYLVENTGNVSLTGVSLVDDQQGPVDCPEAVLEPGQAMTCLAEATAQPGQYANQAQVTADSAAGPPEAASAAGYYFGSDPAVKVQKLLITEVSEDDANDLITQQYLPLGEPIAFRYVISNTGNVPLSDVTVIESNLDLAVICPDDELAPGQAMSCQADAAAQLGQHGNLALVTALGPAGALVSDEDPVYYFGLDGIPALALEKRVNGIKSPLEPGPAILAGTTVTWSYIVSNAGTEALNNISLTDDVEGPISCPLDALSSGQAMICTLEGTAAAEAYQNRATVTAVSAQSQTVLTATADSHYQGVRTAIDLEKYTNGQDADAPPGPLVEAGLPVTWTYVVANTGDVDLAGIRVNDSDPLVAPDCPKDRLAPAEVMVCQATGVSTGQQYSNEATAVAWPTGGLPQVSDSDRSHYGNRSLVYLPLVSK